MTQSTLLKIASSQKNKNVEIKLYMNNPQEIILNKFPDEAIKPEFKKSFELIQCYYDSHLA